MRVPLILNPPPHRLLSPRVQAPEMYADKEPFLVARHGSLWVYYVQFGSRP